MSLGDDVRELHRNVHSTLSSAWEGAYDKQHPSQLSINLPTAVRIVDALLAVVVALEEIQSKIGDTHDASAAG